MGNCHHLGGCGTLLLFLSLSECTPKCMLLYLAAEFYHEMQQSPAQNIVHFEIILDLFSQIIFIIGVLCVVIFAMDEFICLTWNFFKPLVQSEIKGEC